MRDRLGGWEEPSFETSGFIYVDAGLVAGMWIREIRRMLVEVQLMELMHNSFQIDSHLKQSQSAFTKIPPQRPKCKPET